MKKQKKYKYSYNTYQKNAILLIAFLLIAGGSVAYFNYLNAESEDEFDDSVLQVSTEKVKDRTIKDINTELDNLLQQDAPKTYEDRKYANYDKDVQQYAKEKEQNKRDLEDYYRRAQIERENRIKAQEQRARDEQERIRRQQEEERQEQMRRQQQMLEEQRRREYEAQQKQLERMRNNNNNANQNAQNWSNTNFGQNYTPPPQDMTEEEKAAERMRKEMERQQKLDEIRKKTYTPEQQAKIDECQRREARKQAQLDRRRQAPIKSKHKSLPNFQPQTNAPETSGCDACNKY